MTWNDLLALSAKVQQEIKSINKSLERVPFEATSRDGVVKVVMVDDYVDAIVIQDGKHAADLLTQDVMEAVNAAVDARVERLSAGMEGLMAKLGLPHDMKLPF